MIYHGRLIGSFCLLILLTACGNGRQGWASFPVPIYSSSSLLSTPQAQSDFKDAMAFWEAKVGKPVFEYKGAWDTSQAAYTGTVDNPSSIVGNVIFMQNPWPFPTNVVGETTVHSENQEIKGALVMINPSTQFCGGDCVGQPGNITSQRKTFTHELGHFIGLVHIQDVNDIMYPNATAGGSLDGLTVDAAALSKVVPN